MMARTLFLLFVWCGISLIVSAQKRPQDTQDELDKVSTKMTVPKSEGYLDIFTEPDATVTLTAVTARKRGTDSYTLNERSNNDGRATFKKLKPGDYSLKVEKADYRPWTYAKAVKIRPGEPEAFRVELAPLYSTLILGIGSQAAPDVRVLIDDVPVPRDQIEVGVGKITVKRLPIQEDTVRRVRIEKPYHESFEIERLIGPGECRNVVTVQLKQQTGKLILSGDAGTEVYLNGEDRGALANDGKLTIAGLAPGDYLMRAELFGFFDLETRVKITPGKEEELIELKLEPNIETTDISYSFQEKIEQFFPGRPVEWEVVEGRTLRLSGTERALLKSRKVQGHKFSIFEDHSMILKVRNWNGTGMGWVVRAKELNDYYKVELAPSKAELNLSSNKGPVYQMVFSRCTGGGCEVKEATPLATVSASDLREKGFIITTMASGGEIWHCLKIGNEEVKPLGPTYPASVLKGGVGLSGVDGGQVLVDQLLVFPRIINSKTCQRVPERDN